MGTMRSVLISVGDTWVAPLTVSGVFLYEVGGGSGANCSDTGAGRPSGGAGSAEFCGGKPISITPGGFYVAVIGAAGQGGDKDFAHGPIPGGFTEIFGLKALTGGIYRGGSLTGSDSAGDGGGVGGGLAIAAGDGGVWPDSVPKQEAMHYFGGAGGGGAEIYATGAPAQSSGGDVGEPGATVSGLNGGGGGGGSIWGATDGHVGKSGVGSRAANASGSHYGSGAGGTGSGDTGGSDGGHGAAGVIVLMWFE